MFRETCYISERKITTTWNQNLHTYLERDLLPTIRTDWKKRQTDQDSKETKKVSEAKLLSMNNVKISPVHFINRGLTEFNSNVTKQVTCFILGRYVTRTRANVKHGYKLQSAGEKALRPRGH